MMQLSEPFQHLAHHLYFDNLFTSVKLAEDLEQRKTYMCGTYRANRKHIPKEVKTPGRMVQGDSIKIQKGNVVADVWHDKRDVRVLSTNTNPVNGHVMRRSHQDRQQLLQVSCPQSVMNTNRYMGGLKFRLDLCEQLVAGFSCRERHPGKRNRELVVSEGNLHAHDLVHPRREKTCVQKRQ